MKNVLKLSILLLFTLNTMAQNDLTVNSEGIFKFESEIIDYGTITQNADGHRIFTFKNVGNAPIIINKVKGSCGCTVATKPNKPIMPGETSHIKVKYATNRIGSFSKSITISSNAKNKHKLLRIKGTVSKTL